MLMLSLIIAGVNLRMQQIAAYNNSLVLKANELLYNYTMDQSSLVDGIRGVIM